MSKEHMERLQVLRYADSDVRRCRVRQHRCSFSSVCMSVHECVRVSDSFGCANPKESESHTRSTLSTTEEEVSHNAKLQP